MTNNKPALSEKRKTETEDTRIATLTDEKMERKSNNNCQSSQLKDNVDDIYDDGLDNIPVSELTVVNGIVTKASASEKISHETYSEIKGVFVAWSGHARNVFKDCPDLIPQNISHPKKDDTNTANKDTYFISENLKKFRDLMNIMKMSTEADEVNICLPCLIQHDMTLV
jgi:hypothetical protein